MDEPKQEWLLVIYVFIAMTFFTLVGYSVGNIATGVKVGLFVSLATGISIGVRIILDHYTSPLINEEKQP